MYIKDKNKLVGKKITEAVQLRADTLRFTFVDNEELYLTTGSECCSTSWVEHFDAPTFPNNGTPILEVAEFPVNEAENPGKHDCLQVYQTHFRTAFGNIRVEYRNCSNGYYGGSLDLCDKDTFEKYWACSDIDSCCHT